MITPKQIIKMHASAREFNMDDETLHQLVYRETGKESIKLLTVSQAITVIDMIIGKKPVAGGKNHLTDKQYGMIIKLSYDLGWNGDEKRINGFVCKFPDMKTLQTLTMYQAGKVIEGMKKIRSRKQV